MCVFVGGGVGELGLIEVFAVCHNLLKRWKAAGNFQAPPEKANTLSKEVTLPFTIFLNF